MLNDYLFLFSSSFIFGLVCRGLHRTTCDFTVATMLCCPARIFVHYVAHSRHNNVRKLCFVLSSWATRTQATTRQGNYVIKWLVILLCFSFFLLVLSSRATRMQATTGKGNHVKWLLSDTTAEFYVFYVLWLYEALSFMSVRYEFVMFYPQRFEEKTSPLALVSSLPRP